MSQDADSLLNLFFIKFFFLLKNYFLFKFFIYKIFFFLFKIFFLFKFFFDKNTRANPVCRSVRY